uniref:SPARK domain-containing protein n=1 Tax=Nelumbo nucifera TaxID=4432 RepID=A0A822ZRK8_NELNU|nr:TPA_asm: hypothetical protein HUJ06_004391 [Nelumbo nucifera]
MGFELLLLTMVLLSSAANYNVVSTASNTSTCPMDMGYVERVPWDSSYSRLFPNRNNTNCCQTLLSLFNIALVVRLKETSLFQLPDIPTSSTCIFNFQSKLDSLSLPSDLTSVCFSPSLFIASHQLCAGINTKQDWLDKLGPSTTLDTVCQSDLSIGTTCDAYVATGMDPRSMRAACIFGLPLAISTDSKKHSTLVFALTGAGTTAFLRRNAANLEKTSSKRRLGPNTVISTSISMAPLFLLFFCFSALSLLQRRGTNGKIGF